MSLQVSIGHFSLTVPAQPLTASSFAPFGDVIENPRRNLQLPVPVPNSPILSSLPFDAVPANQGTAIKYQNVSRPRDLYSQAPSRVPADLAIDLFVCRSRPLHPVSASASSVRDAIRDAEEEKKRRRSRERGEVMDAHTQTQTGERSTRVHDHQDQQPQHARSKDLPTFSTHDPDDITLAEEFDVSTSTSSSSSSSSSSAVGKANIPKHLVSSEYRAPSVYLPQPRKTHLFPVTILERHPYTTQTFIPLSSPRRKAAYLIIVAPTLHHSPIYAAMPTPTGRDLPGPGLPDLEKLQAFVASGDQAVTYGAGTWHAPMVVLGRPEDKVDFVVVQFANGVGREDCQEVVLQSEAPIGGGLNVEIEGDLEGEDDRRVWSKL